MEIKDIGILISDQFKHLERKKAQLLIIMNRNQECTNQLITAFKQLIKTLEATSALVKRIEDDLTMS